MQSGVTLSHQAVGTLTRAGCSIGSSYHPVGSDAGGGTRLLRDDGRSGTPELPLALLSVYRRRYARRERTAETPGAIVDMQN